METVIEVTKVSQPKGVNRLTNSEVLNGKTITAIDRIKIMSPDEYEDFILEWVDGYINTVYVDVVQIGGAGDKGRDVIGYVDYEKTICDYYQCKHYEKQLTPSVIYLELGKVIYYTFKKIIPMPRKHYFVAPKGEGPKLHDLFLKPNELKAKLLENWNEQVRTNITTHAVELDDDFLTFFNSFDFSIFGSKQPLQIIKEHMQTVWHPRRFGGGLLRTREEIPDASVDIEDFEMMYVQQLFDVYTEYGGIEITCKEDLLSNLELKQHFDECRNNFFSAESLKEFSRDNLPPSTDAFGELKNEVYATIRNIVLMEHKNGFNRLLSSSQAAVNAQFLNNPLHMELKAEDKDGICHHLANENKVKWVKKEN